MLSCTNTRDIMFQNECGQVHRGRLYNRHARRFSHALDDFDYKGLENRDKEGGFVKKII